ncbi:MAG: hypothetical protein ACI4TV_01540, partial [Paludibacteraceae bacterium]
MKKMHRKQKILNQGKTIKTAITNNNFAPYEVWRKRQRRAWYLVFLRLMRFPWHGGKVTAARR